MSKKIENPVVLIHKRDNSDSYAVAITSGSQNYHDALLMASMEPDENGDDIDTWSKTGYYMAQEIERWRRAAALAISSLDAADESNVWRAVGFVLGALECATAGEIAGATENRRSSENVQDLQAGNSPAQGGSRCSIKAAPALDSSPKTAESRCGNSREQSPVVHAYHPDCGCVVCKVATSSNSSDSKTISELTFVIGFDAGKEPPIHAHMEAFGGKVVAVAFRNVLEEHDNDDAASKILDITLPDISSKAFWSGSGKDEVFHPETYKRWTKEAIERYCAIARIEVEVR